jgi:hypothetical protein
MSSDKVHISWMWLPDERVIAVRVADNVTNVAELVVKSLPLDFDEPIRAACERLFDTLEAVGYTHGDDRATVLAGAKVGFEALGLVWEGRDGARVLQ